MKNVTWTIKDRAVGETTLGVGEMYFEAVIGNIDFGKIGIQSKKKNRRKKK